MKTTNNNHEIPVKLTKWDIIKIFIQYSSQLFSTISKEGEWFEYCEVISFMPEIGVLIPKTPGSTYSADKCCVHVKPLERISDEDAFSVCEIADCVKESATKQNNIDFGKRIVEQLWGFNRIGLYGKDLQRIIDFLREQGYAMPYKNWSADQLAEFGIYKLTD